MYWIKNKFLKYCLNKYLVALRTVIAPSEPWWCSEETSLLAALLYYRKLLLTCRRAAPLTATATPQFPPQRLCFLHQTTDRWQEEVPCFTAPTQDTLLFATLSPAPGQPKSHAGFRCTQPACTAARVLLRTTREVNPDFILIRDN